MYGCTGRWRTTQQQTEKSVGVLWQPGAWGDLNNHQRISNLGKRYYFGMEIFWVKDEDSSVATISLSSRSGLKTFGHVWPTISLTTVLMGNLSVPCWWSYDWTMQVVISKPLTYPTEYIKHIESDLQSSLKVLEGKGRIPTKFWFKTLMKRFCFEH